MDQGRRSRGRVRWYAPDPRAILPLGAPGIERTLRRQRRHGFELRIDTSFAEVMRRCARWEQAAEVWISERLCAAYGELHAAGFAHSFEAWDGDDLAAGLYGVTIGRAFMAESMFHERPGAGSVVSPGPPPTCGRTASPCTTSRCSPRTWSAWARSRSPRTSTGAPERGARTEGVKRGVRRSSGNARAAVRVHSRAVRVRSRASAQIRCLAANLSGRRRAARGLVGRVCSARVRSQVSRARSAADGPEPARTARG